MDHPYRPSPRLYAAAALLFSCLCLAGGAPTAARAAAPPSEVAAAQHGMLVGRESHDHRITLGAGQTLHVQLRRARRSVAFNVLAPGAGDVALFAGGGTGDSLVRRVPVAGEYRVRVYLVRSAARRGERSPYDVKLGASGASLTPLPDSVDTVVPGTPFHATGMLRCALPYQPDVNTCDAGVTRYSRDGTATIEIRGPAGFLRRLLFEKGQLVASDAAEEAHSERHDDTVLVSIGSDERYEVPEAFLFGG